MRIQWRFLWALMAVSHAWSGLDAAPAPVDFARQVRPILSNKCFQCHGPDEQSRQGNLRLDLRAGLFERGDAEHRVVVAGDPDQSELIRRVAADDPDVRMPPPDSARLTDDEIALLRSWIAEGAQWPAGDEGTVPVPPKPKAE